MSLVNGRQVRFGGNFASLKDYASKVIVKAIPFLETQVITIVSSQFKLIDNSILSGVISLGTSTLTNGGVVAASLPGAVGIASIVKINDSLGNITNLIRIRNASTHDPITISDREIFALVQAASTVVDGDAIGGIGSENLQLSFVYVASDGTLTLTSVSGTIEFQVNKAYLNSGLPAYEFQGGNVSPDIVAPAGGPSTLQKIATYLITTGFIANEVINLVTGGGGVAGIATPGGDNASIALGANAGVFNADNQIAVLENGIKQIKGSDFIYNSPTSGHFVIALDAGDYFEVTFFA